MSNVNNLKKNVFHISLLQKVPPRWSTRVFYVFILLAFAIRSLLGTLLGVLGLSLLVYAGMWILGDTKPFTFTQLLLWLDDLSIEAKTAVATSLVTVAGFLIAFHTATINWKSQARAQLQANVASEIEAFFAEAAHLLTAASIFVRSLITTRDLLQKDGTTEDALFQLEYTLNQSQEFQATRQRLAAMSVEVHRIKGKHASILARTWGAQRALDAAASAFQSIVDTIWIHEPIVPMNSPNAPYLFVERTNAVKCSEFLAAYERNFDYINRVTGGIRGLLLSPIVDLNLTSLVALLSMSKDLRNALEEDHRTRGKGG